MSKAELIGSAAAAAEFTEVTEEEISRAIKDTNQEIFDEAMGDPSDENDGDRSLEEMDEDDVGGEEEAGDEGADEGNEEVEPEVGEEQSAAEREPPQGRVPQARLKQEADARRAAEAEARAAQAEAREVRARLDALERGQKTEKKEAPAKPDMFADPEGYEKWVLDQAEQRASARFEQQQQQRDEQRVNASLGEAARGARSFEFQAAYGKLQTLDPRDPNAQRTVRGIVNSSDPAKALFDWWDQNGGEEFREGVRAQLIPNYRPQPQRGAPQRQPTQTEERVFRLPKSLNGATGGAHRVSDPDLYDDSESSVFAYATR
jgi:hypothetical protein